MRKSMIAAGVAIGLSISAAPANSGAFFWEGVWYYFSINLDALIAKVTGKDIKLGTNVQLALTILGADSACGNPNSNVINPGKGPPGNAFGQSDNLGEDDLVKKDREQGNIFLAKTEVPDLVPPDKRLNPPIGPDDGICKDAPGASAWVPLFWQDQLCVKNKTPQELAIAEKAGEAVCYKYLARFVGTTLTYVTGPKTGQAVARTGEVCTKDPTNESDPGSFGQCPWTFVYIPTLFNFKATLNNIETQAYDTYEGQCTIGINNEPKAKKRGEPYGFANPPVNGWAATPPVPYNCPQPN